MKTIEQQAVHPHLRSGYLLFGLVAAASAAQVITHYALCDRDGSPACGNIGQTGSTKPPSVSITQHLLAPPANVDVRLPDRPIVDQHDQVVCGNVMSKGGGGRVCRNAAGAVVSVVYK